MQYSDGTVWLSRPGFRLSASAPAPLRSVSDSVSDSIVVERARKCQKLARKTIKTAKRARFQEKLARFAIKDISYY